MIRKHTCKNGVRIVHEKVLHARSLAVGIWIQAGSNDEGLDEAGIAHFIEHMLFKGTKKYSAKYIAEQFDRIGGELNAFTSKEATCFHTTILKEDAKIAMDLLADMLFNSVFDEEEIRKEKQVVLEEIAMYEDTPDDEVHEQLWQSMYRNHPLGKPVLGNRKSVEQFTKQSIQTFMNRLYTPKRIVISIAGNYEDGFIDFIESLFQSFEEPTKNESTLLETPTFYANTVSMSKDVEQAHLCLGFPSVRSNDHRKYALSIVNDVIGESMSSRLFQEVREKQGLAYSIYSYYSLYEQAGTFIIYGGTAPENIGKLQQTITGVLKEAVEQGVSEEEIKRAKQSIRSSFLLGLESMESRMSRNGHQTLFTQDLLTVDEVIETINHITKKEVDQLLQQTFRESFASAMIRP